MRMHAGFDMTGRNKGFTLIELMIVVTIVAILAAIAFPAYGRYVEQARRADAKSALLDAAQRLERCHTQQNTYLGCPSVAGDSPDGFYVIAPGTGADETTANFYRLTATRQGAQSSDTRCGNFWVNSRGDRGVEGASLTADRCW